MKQCFIFCMLLVITVISFSQQNEPTNATVNVDYLKKSKNQKTAAWILTSGGAIAIAGAFAHDLSNIFTDTNSLTGVYIAGAAMISGGVILFTASARNKRKAASSTVSFRTGIMMETSMIRGSNKNFPALNVAIGF